LEEDLEERSVEYEDSKKSARFFVKGSGKARLRWDIFIIVLSVYNSFTIPLTISFSPPILSSPYVACFDAIVDFIFLIDIIITFRTTFLDPKLGEEVTDQHRIASRYLKGGRFFIDFLSSVPLDSIANTNSSILQLFGMLKLARITRISQVIRNSNIKVDIKVGFKVLQLMFYMILYIHVFACLWFFLSKDAEEWVLNMDFIWVYTDDTYEVYYSSIYRQYILCLYTSFYLFGVGEVVPRTDIEFIVSVFILLVSAIVNAIIIGNMAIHQEELSRKSVEFQQKIDLTNTAMSNLSLPKELRKEVHEYI